MSIALTDLGAVAEVIAGQSPPSSTYNDRGEGLPFYQGKADFGEWHPTTRMWCNAPVKIALPDDVLISVRAPVGPTNLADKRCCIGRGLSALRPRAELLASRYLIHFLRFHEMHLTGKGRGSTFSSITQSDLREISIPIPHENGKPDLEEQKRIAAILDKADAIRRKRKQALRLTDDFLRSLFLDMFGDPVTNPKGWEVGPISNGIKSFDGGKNVAPIEAPRCDGIRVLKVSAVTSGEFLEDESKSFNDNFEIPTDYLVKEGDLLISRANTKELIGAVAYVWKTSGLSMLPDKLWRFVWSEPHRIHPLFMLHMARSNHFRNQLILRATGSSGSMKNIGKTKMLEIPIPLPPYPLQEHFANIATGLHSQILASASARDKADELFFSLQQRAFRGEL